MAIKKLSSKNDPKTGPDEVFLGTAQIGDTGAVIGIFLFVLLAFLPALRNGFVDFDDQVYVTHNGMVQQGLTWKGVAWAFHATEAAAWHPLTWLSHMLDCQIYPSQAWGHHLTSILLHAINAALLFRLLRVATGAFWRSVLAAAIFGVHPLRVESVAWIAERKDVLSVFFALLALLAYLQYVSCAEKRRPIYFLLSLFSFVLGLLSKSMVVTLPFILLLLDYWPLKRMPLKNSDHLQAPSWTRLVMEKIPFLLLSAASSAITLVAQQKSEQIRMLQTIPESDRLENAPVSYCRYLGKIFWPANLSVIQPVSFHCPSVIVITAALFLLGVSALAVVLRNRQPFFLVGWLWYLGTLIPVIGLVQGGDQPLADRYTYLPSIGVMLILIWGTFELTKSWPGQKMIWTTIALAVLVGCAILTHRQIGYWKDTDALFKHGMDEAASGYRKIILENPNDARQRINFATLLSSQGRLDEAIEQLQSAVQLAPKDVAARDNLGAVLVTSGQLDEGIQQFEEALRLHPGDAEACAGLGAAFLKMGNLENATKYLNESLRLDPQNAVVHGQLGDALYRSGKVNEAVEEFETSLKLDPASPQIHGHLGLALTKIGRREEAIAQFKEALRLKPDYSAIKQLLQNLENSPAH